VRRAPFEVAFTPLAALVRGVGLLAVHLVSRGLLAWPSAIGVACVTFLHAGGAAAARAALWERKLDGARRLVLPNFDALRTFATGYRRWLCQTAVMLPRRRARGERGADIGVHRHDVGAVGRAARADRAGADAADDRLVRVAAAPHRGHRALLRDRGAQPARPRAGAPDPDAVAAFRAAQNLPYRLSGYQAIASAIAVAAVVLIGRKAVRHRRLDRGPRAGRQRADAAGDGAVRDPAAARRAAAAAGPAGARHRLPVDEVRAPITLRTEAGASSSRASRCSRPGLVLLFALSPSHALWIMLASIALALALALGWCC
jgi:hypothetical protein